jgi:hypothetical protein
MTDLFLDAGAEFDETRKYRFLLWRQWAPGPYMLAIGLNPSTADETKDDATMRLLRGRCVRMGLSGFYMTNLFPYRATHPTFMKSHPAPLGTNNNPNWNDERIFQYAPGASLVLVCWGNDGEHMNRGLTCLNDWPA